MILCVLCGACSLHGIEMDQMSVGALLYRSIAMVLCALRGLGGEKDQINPNPIANRIASAVVPAFVFSRMFRR